jgi:predicted enzyme related to lactoylglutathione lyase
MNQGMGPVIYPVKDLAAAKSFFSALLGVEPSTDTPYYVGYQLGEQHVGLDPNGHDTGLTGPKVFYDVDDIKDALSSLVAAGATMLQNSKDVGGGLLVASVRDADGNDIGLRQLP